MKRRRCLDTSGSIEFQLEPIGRGAPISDNCPASRSIDVVTRDRS